MSRRIMRFLEAYPQVVFLLPVVAILPVGWLLGVVGDARWDAYIARHHCTYEARSYADPPSEDRRYYRAYTCDNGVEFVR